MNAEASETVSVPRAELDALKAELKRLRREAAVMSPEGVSKPTLAQAMTRQPSTARS